MSSQELCFLALAEQARLIRTKGISPVDLVGAALRQIERIEGRINAFISVMADAAMSAARDAEAEIAKGDYRGPLHGIPIALKDLFYTRGVRTTAGSKIMRDFVPAEDATVVTRLREAGAVIIGKTGMHEYAFGTINTNPHFGDVRNPWNLERITGGSSGGSAAAVAAFMCSAALGTDTGGSIRIPASFCGLFGIKPTFGRVSRHGVVPLAWSLDTVGPLTRTAQDAALLLGAVAGWDSKDPESSQEPVPDYAAALHQPISGLRVAVLREYVDDPTEPGVLEGFRAALDALRHLGAQLEDVSVPGVEAAVCASTAIMFAEAASYHEETLRTRPQDYGADVRTRLEQGLRVSAIDYLKGQRTRRSLADSFLALMERYDAIICPTVPAAAPLLGQDMVQFEGLAEPIPSTATRHTRLFNLTGQPAVSAPCGFDSNGMPIGIQIATAPFAEATALRIAHAYETSTGWGKQLRQLREARVESYPPVALRRS